MLHKYEKIDEAMAACVALEYPLVVIVHGKLPANLYNAEEAARGSRGGAAAATYSFLPPSYGAGNSHAFMSTSINGSSSLFTDDNILFESALTAPSQDAAKVNAALGYLMRPAILTSAAAADNAAVAEAVASGEELTLVNDFPLGSLQGGAAQREALLITLLESRLGSVTLLHLIEEGTPAYGSFSAAVPVPMAGSASVAVLPRVHIFYAPTVGLAPMVLHGATLTPQNLYNCVQMGLLRPRTHNENTTNSSVGSVSAANAASGLRAFFTNSITSMNAEYGRSRQQSTTTAPAAATSATIGGNNEAQQRSNSGSNTTAITVPMLPTPAQQAAGVNRTSTLAAAHLISVAGLPTCFSTVPIPGSPSSSNNGASGAVGAHKTILTTPTMTMQTVWRAVEKHLDWAQHEVQQAQAASVWNGVTPPKPGVKFTLTVGPTHDKDAGKDKAPLVVKTLTEAAQVRLQDFPRNTVVRVEFEGWPPAGHSSAATSAASAPAPQQLQPVQYVCEGDTCRRIDSGSAAALATAATVSEDMPSQANKESISPTSVHTPSTAAIATTAPSSSPHGSVKLHCSLPNGKTLDVDQLDPNTDTLQANVRPIVEAALGYSSFLFVCAYPPKRYSAENDEPRPLKDIGLSRSSALRVVALDGPGSQKPVSASGQQQQKGSTRQMFSNAAASLLGLFGGRNAQAPTAAPPGSAYSSSNASSRTPPRQRRTYNSMAEMLAANEAAERETAVERLRQEQQQQQRFMGHDPADAATAAAAADQRGQGKKSNRYFGGGSTEYIAEDDNERNGEKGGNGDDNPRAVEGTAQEQQSAFLREQLQRLMRQQRRSMAGDRDCEEGKDGDEGNEEGLQRNGGNGGVAEHHRAFEGQGRRLAGDAPQGPSAGDTSAAKKNQ